MLGCATADGAARWPLSCTRRVLDRRVTYKRVVFGWPPVDGSGKPTVTSLALVRFGVWRYDRCCAIPTCVFDLRPPHKCPDPPRRAQGPGATHGRAPHAPDRRHAHHVTHPRVPSPLLYTLHLAARYIQHTTSHDMKKSNSNVTGTTALDSVTHARVPSPLISLLHTSPFTYMKQLTSHETNLLGSSIIRSASRHAQRRLKLQTCSLRHVLTSQNRH